MNTPPKASRIPDFATNNGICRATVYKEIRIGRLRAVKAGNRTLILEEDAEKWRKSLPAFKARG